MESMEHRLGMYKALLEVTNEALKNSEDTRSPADKMQNLAGALINDVIHPLEYWTHYKGGIYMILTISIKEDTLEPVVVYSSLKHNTSWVRTVSNFLEMVTLPDGSQVHRFQAGAP